MIGEQPMAHDDQFTATGPAFTGAGFSRAAFSTNRVGTDCTYGVNAQGSTCGVYGESVQTSPLTNRQAPKPNAGVCGIGDDFGVFGKGRTKASVQAETDNFSAIGVVALNKDRRLSPNINSVGIATVSATEAFRGYGVVGLSMRQMNLTQSGTTPRVGRDPQTGKISLENLELGGGTGVLGATGIFPRAALGTSTGVAGVGGTGVVGIGHWEGVDGRSDSGHAVIGTTRAGVGVEGIGEDTGAGVVGRSASGVGGFFTSLDGEALVGRSGGSAGAVRGTANAGIGVRGEAQGFGVYGASTTQAGVLGHSGKTVGVFGFTTAAFQVSGPPAGVLGINDQSVGVIGSSANAIGVWGNTGKGLAVLGTTNSGAGAPTDHITDEGIAVTGLTDAGVGVAGMSESGTGVYGQSRKGPAGHFKGDVLVEGSFTVVGGTKSAAVPHPDGAHRQLYCMESPESWFEDFGEAELVNGAADVALEPAFAALIDVSGYQVFLTAYGDTRGLFVADRTAEGFRVREQQGAASRTRFGYRIVARRKDVDAPRLPRVHVPAARGKSRFPSLQLELAVPDIPEAPDVSADSIRPNPPDPPAAAVDGY
jgi:hypothetical protein